MQKAAPKAKDKTTWQRGKAASQFFPEAEQFSGALRKADCECGQHPPEERSLVGSC